MITLTATINLLTGENGTLGGVFSNFDGNNISANISRVLGSKKQATNPFIIGASRLGDGSTISGKVDYFIGKELSDENGDFASGNPFSLQIYGEDINSVTIAFDTQNNRHPKSIFINGEEYVDDDAIFTVTNLYKASALYCDIYNWNTPYYPVVITGIYVSVTIEVDRRILISIDSTIFDRGDTKLPSYGIISNTGNIEFNDLNGEIRDYAEQQLLTSDLKVRIFLTNTLTKARQQVADFETQEWDYDKDNRSVSVSLKDDLIEWQDIHIDGFSYDPRSTQSKTMQWYYEWLHERTPEKYEMLPYSQLDQTTQDILYQTDIKYPMLNGGSLWEQWQKICQVCGLYIYKNGKGKTVCKYVYGS